MFLPVETVSQSLATRFLQVRSQTEKLCQPLIAEDSVVQPVIDVSPPKWHLAHTTWFFETFILQKNQPGYRVFHEKFNFLFNSYYNSIGSRVLRNQRGIISRPGLEEVYKYRAYVNEQMQEFLDRTPEEELTDILPVLELGLQHEQQHQELLVTDIKYILSSNPLLPVYQKKPEQKQSQTPQQAQMLDVPGGLYQIGYRGNGFCFDNELGVHQVYIDDFQLQNKLVTNREYMEFMNDGGYKDFRHWLADGFDIVQEHQWEAPLYWLKTDGHWQYFTLNGMQEPEPEAPVCHLSFYEANAYASWAGKRLLTEFEWEIAAKLYNAKPENGNFLESGFLQPQATSSSEACKQMLGDVWEWTYSPYHPYPGYSKAPGALGEYNGKFMINQMILRGGSCVTPQSHIRTTYRNFFPADKRWQFSGIRLAI